MKIVDFFSKLTFKDIIIILLVIFGVWSYFSMKNYKEEANRITVVYNDSISSYKNKLGEQYAAKDVYIQSIADLKSNNKELADEIASLKANPIVVVNKEIVYVKDSTQMNDSIHKLDSLYYTIRWNLAEQYNGKNFFTISGHSTIKNDFSSSSSYLDNLSIGADLTLDIVEKDKTHFQVITKSGNPNIKFTNINGAVIDPNQSKVIKNTMKEKNFGIGLYGGYGLNATPNEKVNTGFQIGVGIVWSPSWLRF